jgi:hypothetical protein
VNALVTQVSEATGEPVEGPAVDVSVYAAGAESAADAVARGLEALGIAPAEAGHGDDAHDGAHGAAPGTPASE